MKKAGFLVLMSCLILFASCSGAKGTPKIVEGKIFYQDGWWGGKANFEVC